jgi:hypothetical protein
MDHQREYLATDEDTVFLKGRQVGATQSAAGLAIHVARTMPGSLTAIISPSMTQSTEVGGRARLGLWQLGHLVLGVADVGLPHVREGAGHESGPV